MDIADVNGDGELDFLIGSSINNSLDVVLSGPRFSYSAHTLLTGSEGFFPSETSFVDMDGDGDLDVGAVDRLNKLIWFEALPTVMHAAPSPLVVEEDGGNTSAIAFTRAGDISGEETFNFTVFGSATFGSDYSVAGAASFTPTTGSIIFLAGDSTATLTITPLADGDFEGDETVVIRIADYADIGLPPQPENPTDVVVTIRRDEPEDFGDTPDTYLTTAAHNGPSHGVTGPMLGATRDSEPDGQATPLADGEGPDDDGITFAPLRAGDQDAIVTVNVQNARGCPARCYGYVAPEPPAVVIASEPATATVLTESEIAPANTSFVLTVSSTQVSRPEKLVARPVAPEQFHDRVFTELGTPSKTFFRDFGDISVRRLQKQQRLRGS
jgi:hypothetical protein